MRWSFRLLALIIFLICGNTTTDASDTILNIHWEHLSSSIGFGIAWSPDGKQIVSSDGIDTLSTFDLQNRQVHKLIKLPIKSDQPDQSSIEWSPDGKFIAAALDGRAFIINPTTGEIVQTLPKTKMDQSGFEYAREIRWMNDSLGLVAFDPNGYIGIFDIQTGDLIKVIDLGEHAETSWANSIAWNNDSDLFAARNFQSDSIWFWNKNGELLTQNVHQDSDNTPSPSCKLGLAAHEQIYGLGWAKRGQKLAVATGYDLIVCTLGDDGSLTKRIVDGKIEDTKTNVYWSTEGNWLVSNILVLSEDTDCVLKIYDTTHDYKLIQTLQNKQPCFDSLVWSPNDKFIAAGNNAGLWLGTVETS